jgi:hypothetical protein
MARVTRTSALALAPVTFTARIRSTLQVYDRHADTGSLRYLEAAEGIAESLLAGGGIIYGDAQSRACSDLAERVEGSTTISELQAKLDAIDEHLKELKIAADQAGGKRPTLPWANDAAVNRWMPEMLAHYYLGVAIGYRLAAGGVR